MRPSTRWAVVGSAAVLGVGGGIAAAATISPLRDPVSVLEMDRSPVQLGSEVPDPLADPTAPVEPAPPTDAATSIDLTESPEQGTDAQRTDESAGSQSSGSSGSQAGTTTGTSAPATSTSRAPEVRRTESAPRAVAPAPAVASFQGDDSPDSPDSPDSADSAD